MAKPKDLKLKHGELWCPYCHMAERFKTDGRLGVKRCVACRISENDYYVKKYNQMFGSIRNIKQKRKERKVVDNNDSAEGQPDI